MTRLEGLGQDDLEDINWNITTKSITPPRNNTLPLHKTQNRTTRSHGFQDTGSKSFSTEDSFLGIKTEIYEFPGEQPKTSTPNTSIEVHNMESPSANNPDGIYPVTSTPREP